MNKTSFKGVLAPVITPFGRDLSPDGKRLAAHCRWLLAQGLSGLAVFGTTSEANSLGMDERMALLDGLLADGIAIVFPFDIDEFWHIDLGMVRRAARRSDAIRSRGGEPSPARRCSGHFRIQPRAPRRPSVAEPAGRSARCPRSVDRSWCARRSESN